MKTRFSLCFKIDFPLMHIILYIPIKVFLPGFLQQRRHQHNEFSIFSSSLQGVFEEERKARSLDFFPTVITRIT